MREIVLRHFFEGQATADELQRAAHGMLATSATADGVTVARYQVEPMAGTFELRSENLLRLLDATAAGTLGLAELSAVCDWLDAGAFERFRRDVATPDGARVADALFWLGTPESNYPLTVDVLTKIRHYLVSGRNTLTAADAGGTTGRPPG